MSSGGHKASLVGSQGVTGTWAATGPQLGPRVACQEAPIQPAPVQGRVLRPPVHHFIVLGKSQVYTIPVVESETMKYTLNSLIGYKAGPTTSISTITYKFPSQDGRTTDPELTRRGFTTAIV